MKIFSFYAFLLFLMQGINLKNESSSTGITANYKQSPHPIFFKYRHWLIDLKNCRKWFVHLNPVSGENKCKYHMQDHTYTGCI